MLNRCQKGLTVVDTLLALVVLFFLTATLMPLISQMKQQLLLQQMQAHAAEVAFNGALKYKRYGELLGQQQIDGVMYYWHFEEGGICVNYVYRTEEKEQCIS